MHYPWAWTALLRKSAAGHAPSILRLGLPAILCLLLLASPLGAVNLLTNPSFAGNLNGWAADPSTVFDGTVDATGTPGSGSARNTYNAAGASTLLAISQCIAAGPGTYTLGGKVFIPGGQAVGGSGLITVSFFSGPDCLTGFLSFSSLTTSTTGSFVTLSGPVTAPAGTAHIWVTGQNSAAAAGTHVVYWDDFVFDNGVTGPPTISKAFSPASITAGQSAALSFTIGNPNGITVLTGVAFTDTLPAGMVVATPNGLTGSCGGGTITATVGSNSVALTGATLAPLASCTFSVNVVASTVGTSVNTTGAVTSANGGTGGTATASLTVNAPPTVPALSSWGLCLLGMLTAGLASALLRPRRRMEQR